MRPIGLVVAMEAELFHLLPRAENIVDRDDGIWHFREMKIAGRDVVALRSGMGLINAAAGAECLIARYAPSHVMNFGCSGAHRRDIMPGDLIIGESVVHHSAVHILADGSELYTGFGYEVAGERMNANELRSDPGIVAIAKRIAETHTPLPWPVAAGWPSAVPYRTPVIHTGPVASADVWTQSMLRLDLLHARHGSLCEDMEAAAIAQVAARHRLPFFTVKDISNNEYLKASDIHAFTDFPVAEVGKRAASLLVDVIESMPG